MTSDAAAHGRHPESLLRGNHEHTTTGHARLCNNFYTLLLDTFPSAGGTCCVISTAMVCDQGTELWAGCRNHHTANQPPEQPYSGMLQLIDASQESYSGATMNHTTAGYDMPGGTPSG
jgi:hypothetical protein